MGDGRDCDMVVCGIVLLLGDLWVVVCGYWY